MSSELLTKALRAATAFFVVLAVSSCGYRAAMHKTVITEDPERFQNVRPEYRELAALMTTDTGMPPTDSNTVAVITDEHQKLDLLLHDINQAQESIYIEQFRVTADSCGTIIADSLKVKASKGLDVKVMGDRGKCDAKDRKALRAMRPYGIDAQIFYAPSWPLDYLVPPGGAHRDHRKIMLFDGKVGYIGGRNIQDKYFRDWRDIDLRISGLALLDMATVFSEGFKMMSPDAGALKITAESAVSQLSEDLPGVKYYRGKTIQIVPDSPWDKRLPTRNCYEWSIGNSKEYFYFYNPYFPPPASTVKALKEAAARGVDVRWIVPGKNDVAVSKWVNKSFYRQFLKSGIRVYEWNGEMMHAKEFIKDDYLLGTGSANMDNLSLFLDMEVSALVYDEEMTVDARKLFLSDAADNCREVTLEEVRKWSIFKRFWFWLARSVAGFML